ncbi:hypothetical protein RB195_022781 [Necator americanus]|uniref:Uncharacterized protein n=1 Tax=Necator americanus TaxID=51031 RepID=A0ABR1EHI6_NECAM
MLKRLINAAQKPSTPKRKLIRLSFRSIYVSLRLGFSSHFMRLHERLERDLVEECSRIQWTRNVSGAITENPAGPSLPFAAKCASSFKLEAGVGAREDCGDSCFFDLGQKTSVQ